MDAAWQGQSRPRLIMWQTFSGDFDLGGAFTCSTFSCRKCGYEVERADWDGLRFFGKEPMLLMAKTL
jgi:hypothetical protein